MLSHCFKCRKNTESKNPKAVKTKNGGLMFYQNVKCSTIRNLLKSKKLVDYYVV